MAREEKLAEMLTELHRIEDMRTAGRDTMDEDDFRILGDMAMELEAAIDDLTYAIYG